MNRGLSWKQEKTKVGTRRGENQSRLEAIKKLAQARPTRLDLSQCWRLPNWHVGDGRFSIPAERPDHVAVTVWKVSPGSFDRRGSFF
jgi:hypothetical protein